MTLDRPLTVNEIRRRFTPDFTFLETFAPAESADRREGAPTSPSPRRPDLLEMAAFMGPGEVGEPPQHRDLVRGISERARREPAERVDQASAHPGSAAEERRQGHGARR